MRRFLTIICLVLLHTIVGQSLCFAALNRYIVDTQKSMILCSVKYAVVPTLKAHFTDYSGEINFDPKHLEKSSVELHFRSAGLDSGEKHINRVIVSRRVLDAKHYPEIVFISRKLFEKEGQLWVSGIVDLHGVKKEISFPFKLENVADVSPKKKMISAHGKWILNRKEFNIVWHPTLDKGGVVVGDYITIDWVVKAETN